ITSSITAQQTKLDHELVPKEKRLEIGKCNGRLNPGKKQRGPTFQGFLDALALTSCYSTFLTTADVLEVYMHQFWDSIHKYETSYRFRMDKKKKFDLNLEIFRDIFQICPRVHSQNFNQLPTDEVIVSFFKKLGHTGKSSQSLMLLLIRCINLGEPLLLSSTEVYLERQPVLTSFIDNKAHKKQEKMYYPQFIKVIIHYFLTKDKTVSWRNKIGMHTSMDDYMINTLRFVSANEVSQIYGARLPESMTSLEMRETKAYKTYLGYATGVIPLKKARKFKKPASPKLTTVFVSPKEPMRKSKRVKRPSKKSTNAPTIGVVIRDSPMMCLSKKKKKMTVEKCKGIDLLSEVALTEEAYGSAVVTKIAPSAANIKPSVINEGTGAKLGVPDVTKEESSESEAES
ncbi:hypothetical protein Tco_1461063, partial [Tanacetum coccineum]